MGILTNRANYQDIDGVLWGWQWAANQPNNHTLLYYSFPTSAPAYGYIVSGFEPFNGLQQVAAHRAIANADAVCNLDFVYTTDGASGNIRFAEADSFSIPGFTWDGESAFGIAPDGRVLLAAHGDTWFNHSFYNTPVMGSFAYYAGVLHEMGHALGLGHGHMPKPVFDANGNVIYTNPALPAAHDGLEYSVMTYRAYPGVPVNESDLPDEGPSTLMQNDILALQWMYGANYNYNSKNTTYRWNNVTGEMSVNGVREGVPFHNKVLMTIWDGGGIDTYDFSNFATPATIDLGPGDWSTPSSAMLVDFDDRSNVTHLARGCIANALAFKGDYRGYIENAWGGSGNDIIYGNELRNELRGNGGNDRLVGGAGNDTLVGGAGNDTYYADGGDAILEAANGGTDAVLSSESYTLGANLEFLTLTGMSAINGIGNALNNQILGNPAANVLRGGAGRDYLLGGGGDDVYYTDGSDTIMEWANAGNDEVDSSVTYTLGANLEYLALTGTAAINGYGNALANVLVGNAAANLLASGLGNDLLFGLAGNDRLRGDAGHDTLSGARGNDVMRGGTGNDTFVFDTTPNGWVNRDTIADFANAAGNNDRIALQNAVFTKLGGGVAAHGLNPAFFRAGAAAHDANDFIIYNKGTGTLFYDVNGSGAGGAIHFATLATRPTLTNADFIVI
jgi:serralysin